MASVARIYSTTILEEFKLNPNFPPGRPVALGDYGILEGLQFRIMGNIKDPGLEVPFEETEDPETDNFEFTSSDSSELTFTAKGEGGPAVKAGLQISFSKKEAVFFVAAGCRHIRIKSPAALRPRLIELLKAGLWKKEYLIVGEAVRAGATTVIISGSSQSAIGLEAEAKEVENIKLTDASIKLAIKREKNVSFKIVTEQGLTPMMRLLETKVLVPKPGDIRTGFTTLQAAEFAGDDLQDAVSLSYMDFERVLALRSDEE